MERPFRTRIEPFRTKVAEPIHFTTDVQRREYMTRAGYNPFTLHAEHVTIDLLTDSGTSAMSSAQWGALMQGDESYAGSASFYRLEAVVKRLTGLTHVIPTHQGRAAEKILFATTARTGMVIPNNTHFDTTRANVEFTGASAVDLVCPEGMIPENSYPFKGNMDVERLEALLKSHGRAQVPLVMVTVTNNSNGGQPVSLANLTAVREVTRRYGIPLFLDACRFAENAWFIKTREPGQAHRSVTDIAHDMFRLVDGCTMSGKKDGLVNIGGFLAVNDESWAQACRNLLVLTEGFPTYGGLAARDMDALAVGLQEVLSETYLEQRIEQVAFLANRLARTGIPVLTPPGGHAVYVLANKLLPHIPVHEFPGQALVCELYLEAGVRACEIGTVMFGKSRADGSQEKAAQELVRLAIPRRSLSQAHLEYVGEAFERLLERKHTINGLKLVYEPKYLRHFTARFEPLPPGIRASVAGAVEPVVASAHGT